MYQSTKSFFSRQFKLVYVGLAICMSLATTGCVHNSHYVATILQDVPQGKMKKVQDPKPVQLLVEFETNGASNPHATDSLQSRVTDIVKNSGLFSQVESMPVKNGAILSIIINNVPLKDNVAANRFAPGITLSSDDAMAADGYICTVSYIADANTPKISKTVRHAIYSGDGAKAPPNALKANSIQDAEFTMLRQIVNNGLNDLANDPSFK